MTKIRYIDGDVLAAPIDKTTILMHVCNNQGAMGAGIALQIKNKWPRVYDFYRNHKTLELGTTQWVTIPLQPTLKHRGGNLIVINLIAQTLGWNDGKIPLCYDALRKCLTEVAFIAKRDKLPVRCPMIGSALAGGNWDGVIKPMIDEVFAGVNVDIYRFVPPTVSSPIQKLKETLMKKHATTSSVSVK